MFDALGSSGHEISSLTLLSNPAPQQPPTGYVTVLPTWTQLPADWDEEWTLVEKHLEHTTEQKILLQPSQI